MNKLLSNWRKLALARILTGRHRQKNMENMTKTTEENVPQKEEAVNGESRAEKSKKKSKKSAATKLKEELEQVEAQHAELKDKYLRLLADFDNFKKRNARERLDLISTAGQEIMSGLLPVLDDFNRAMKTLETAEEVSAVKEGMALIFNKMKNELESRGLKEMESVGQDFDPEFHEAITEIAAPEKKLKGKVVDEIESGYYLREKIIRHAKVVVGK